ncbi:slc38a2 [Symbiodinium pilosum]|uniref:Slc38a2 protein n=1 Tax=Symbiodinium pilosum TaxID=2952 RepID=A0A812K736_SYMPI|nr:slc38a2 [Symbiodinium pilosum]
MPTGLEEFCFEPVGEEKTSKWNQVGPKKGSYIQIDTYQNVGQGFGDYDKSRSGDFHKVREGSGAYKQIQTYQHVGAGLGNYDKEDVTSYSGWKLKKGCLIVLVILVVLLVSAVAYLLMHKDPNAAFHQGEIAHSHALLDHDCNAGYATWQSSWSDSKKAFCCSSIGVACSQTSYDCDAGYDQWQSLWSSEKKDYCCDRTGRGCSKAYAEDPYDCQVGLDNWQSTWSQGKQLWCCSTHQLGCPQYSLSFDCEADFASWRTAWSWSQKHWCCVHEKKGCDEPAQWDCQAGLSRWRSGWSHAKKTWCCRHEHVGCLSTVEPFDCHAGLSNWQHGWSERKKRYCCVSHSLGCVTTTPTTLPFDCMAGYGNWQHGWSDAKKAWCCQEAHRGCMQSTSHPTTSAPPSTPAPASCHSSCIVGGHGSSCAERITHTAMHEYAHEEGACRKAYSKVLALCDVCHACGFEEAQCRQLPVEKPAPFDCRAGLGNLDSGWSQKKKDWCCTHQHLGCPVSFDCDAGLANFYAAWSARKKNWCCRKEGKGCLGPHAPHLPAGNGFLWKRAQVHGYWTWIRSPAHVHHDHPSDQYNCQAGFHNFVHAWSDVKQHWCCHHRGISCTGPNPPAVHLRSGSTWVHVKIEGVWTWRQVPRDQNNPHVVDCSTGLDQAANWAPSRKKYCCTHEGKAC